MNKKLKEFLALFFIELIIFLPIALSIEISSVSVNSVSTTATITWKTNVPGDTRFDYGKSTAYDYVQSSPQFTTDHAVSVSGLLAGTKYYYKIRSLDVNDQSSTITGTFFTRDDTPPRKVVNLKNGSIGIDSVTLYWDATGDNDVDKYVIYSNGNYLGETRLTSFYVTQLHELTQYTFSVYANDTSGNSGDRSDSVTIKTKDSTPPEKVNGLRSGLVSNTSIALIWNDVAANDLKEYVVLKNNVEVTRVRANSYTASGLAPVTQYAYQVYAVDTSGNNGEKSDILTLKTSTSFANSNLEITNITAFETTVSWSTNDLSNSTVYYGITSTDNIVSSGEQVTSHSLNLTGIESGRRYYYYVKSCRSSGCIRSTQQSFVAGYSGEVPEINASIPEYSFKNQISFNGSTKSQSSVQVLVNGILRGTYPNTGTEGFFKFSNILLDTRLKLNTLTLVVRDFAGQNNSKDYTINVDTDPLMINATVPEATPNSTFDLKANINKMSDIKIYVLDDVKNPPAKVENLSAQANANVINLRWNAVNGTDKYLIYRSDVGLVATSFQPAYTDTSINKSKTYTYYVSAQDRSCNEGERSSSVSVQSQTQTDLDLGIAQLAGCSFSPQRELTSIQGDFNANLNLKNGANVLRVEATAKSGQSIRQEWNIVYDTVPVQILSPTDLSRYSPVYSPEINIKGQVNKKSKIYVYLDKSQSPSKTIDTDSDGSFKLSVDLANYNTDKSNSTSIDYAYNNPTAGRTTNVKLVAEDYLGKKSNAVVGDITYAICSYGFAWKIKVEQTMPSLLIPSMIRAGTAQIGLPFKIEWQGGANNYTAPTVRVTQRVLSPKEKEYWDSNWVATTNSQISYDASQGYITIKLKSVDPFPGDKTKTELARENNISIHRFTKTGKADSLSGEQVECLAPGFGCVKVPLIMELKYLEVNETKIQRQCWDVEVQIDRRADPKIIPKTFLQGAVLFANNTISLIDAVLEPITTIMPYAFYGCLGAMLVSWVWAQGDMIRSVLASVYAKGGLNPEVPKGGYDACNAVYNCDSTKSGADAGTKKLDATGKSICDACAMEVEKITARQQFDRKYHWVCDRIFSPAVPTFQKYVKDAKTKGDNAGKVIKITGKDKNSATTAPGNLITKNICDGVDVGTENIIRLYRDASDPSKKIEINVIKGKTWTKEKVDLKTYCTQMIPYGGLDFSSAYGTSPAPENLKSLCCYYQYLADWEAGCPLMDIGKESACIAAEIGNEKEFQQEKSCNNIINKIAGVCEKNGKQVPEIVLAGPLNGLGLRDQLAAKNAVQNSEDINTKFDKIEKDCTGGVPIDSLKDSKRSLYFYIQKPEDGNGKYEVGTAVIVENLDLKIAAEQEKTNSPVLSKLTKLKSDDDSIEISSTTVLKKTSNDYTKFFEKENLKLKTGGTYVGVDEFSKKISNCVRLSPEQSKRLYQEILNKIGVPDQQYVADPSSGLIRSIQCISLPAVKGYLEMWRKILVVARDCFQTILTTGDGSAGVCRALVTVYLCDIIYDVISCFMQKYEGSYAREGGYQGFSGLLGGISDAGASVTKSITGRYGNTNAFNAVFGERKLVHAMCTWAFTGDWVFDANAAMKSNFDVPVESQAFIAQANRRFLSFNPVAQSAGLSGLTTYNYHLALMLVAGTDVQYNIRLCCSSDYSCTDADYAGGKCDCAAGGAQTTITSTRGVSYGTQATGTSTTSTSSTNTGTAGLSLQTSLPTAAYSNVLTSVSGQCIDVTSRFGTGTLKRGEILNAERDFLAENHKMRYDKVILNYAYVGSGAKPKTAPEPTIKSISLVGGTPPAFCSFDVGYAAFRCTLDYGKESYSRLGDISTQQTYNVGDTFLLKADVSNKIPENPDCVGQEICKDTKFLTLQVNLNGKTIWKEADQVLKLNKEMSDTLVLPNAFSGVNTLTFSDKTILNAITATGITTLKSSNTASIIKNVDHNAMGEDEKFGFIFSGKGDYKICTSVEKASNQMITVDRLSNCNSGGTLDKNTLTYKGAVISFTNTPADSWVAFSYTKPKQTCSSAFKGTATVTIYDAVYDSQNSQYKMSTTPSTSQGVINRKNVDFLVNCPNAATTKDDSFIGRIYVAKEKEPIPTESSPAKLDSDSKIFVALSESKLQNLNRIINIVWYKYASTQDDPTIFDTYSRPADETGNAYVSKALTEVGFYKVKIFRAADNAILAESQFIEVTN